jgi:hypothetical protein
MLGFPLRRSPPPLVTIVGSENAAADVAESMVSTSLASSSRGKS